MALSAEDSKKALKYAQGRLKKSRLPALLGFHIESLQPGKAVLSMRVQGHHKQIHDVVHGGVLAALADTAAAIAAYTVVPHGTEIATIELKINYLSAVPDGEIKAEGKVLRAGRNFIVTECEVFDAKGGLAAKALLTFGAAAGHSMESPASPAKK
ncbi:MAG TPA: PaaI family thioesterase [Candidatus Acidoferrum sp.]|nr:PaaI family thioesterase [Candidatus Acidoferrum sp.]